MMVASRLLIGLCAASCATLAACSLWRRTPAPSSPSAPSAPVVGIASWYGPGFDGRPTASGEIYNQEDLTAASNLFPLGSRVMVTNESNRCSVEVRINDRGPFLKGRKIDLSHKAAELLGVVDPGTARVRIDPLGPPVRLADQERFFVQFGAFAESANASRLRNQLASRYTDVKIETVNAGRRRFYRVRIGAFSSRAEALARAQDPARLGLPVVIVTE